MNKYDLIPNRYIELIDFTYNLGVYISNHSRSNWFLSTTCISKKAINRPLYVMYYLYNNNSSFPHFKCYSKLDFNLPAWLVRYYDQHQVGKDHYKQLSQDLIQHYYHTIISSRFIPVRSESHYRSDSFHSCGDDSIDIKICMFGFKIVSSTKAYRIVYKDINTSAINMIKRKA